MEMSSMVPAGVPSCWMICFGIDDVDPSCRTTLVAGAHEIPAPEDFPGRRFAILGDPQGADFGLHVPSRARP
jgi:predicted enzyme related to lactoylglutathione lyase